MATKRNKNKKRATTVMVIPDTQNPFQHPDTYEFLGAVKRAYKPDAFVHIGDEVDFHGLGQWDIDPNGYSAGHELQAALESLQPMYKMFPEMMVCTSNHTARPFRKAFKHGIPQAFLRDYKEFLEAPRGWTWADYWEIGNVRFEHGEGFSGKEGALKAARANMQSTVIGHLHSHAGILWDANAKHLIFGFNVGCLIDRHAYAFAYGKKHPHKPILGCGIIRDDIPQFIPMLLKPNGRWAGRL